MVSLFDRLRVAVVALAGFSIMLRLAFILRLPSKPKQHAPAVFIVWVFSLLATATAIVVLCKFHWVNRIDLDPWIGFCVSLSSRALNVFL
jgi:hypothetical protein